MENSEQNTQPTQIVTDNIINNDNISRVKVIPASRPTGITKIVEICTNIIIGG